MFVVYLVAFVSLVNPDRLARLPVGSLAANAAYEFGMMASRILQLQHIPAGQFTVVIIGASATREGITSFDDLGRRLSELVGEPVYVVPLVSGGQFHPDYLLLNDNLPDDFRGVVVADITPRHLSLPADIAADMIKRPRLPVSTSLQADALELLGASPPDEGIGNWFIDNHRFFAARPTILVSTVFPPQQTFRFVTDWRPPTPAEWERIEKRAYDWISDIAIANRRNVDLFNMSLRPIASRDGVSIVLLEPPRNPALVGESTKTPEIIAAEAGYLESIEELQRSIPSYYFDSTGLPVPAEDFFDLMHIKTQSGREIFTNWLAESIADICRNPSRKGDS